MTVRIVPRFKIIMQYDINPDQYEDYYRFVMQDFVQGMASLGLHMYRVYHTAYGAYPVRYLEFLSEDIDTVRKAQASATWKRLHDKLHTYVTDYSLKVLRFREGFQI